MKIGIDTRNLDMKKVKEFQDYWNRVKPLLQDQEPDQQHFKSVQLCEMSDNETVNFRL